MCIIACKPVGLKMPTEDTITNMWYSNPDGAGIMYNHDGHVHIEKGFMKLNDFLDALERIGKTVDLDQAGVVMHFRITTHGGTRPENCHPFPISDSIPMLKKLRLSTHIGVAHNGIIHNTPRSKDISDTMEYIASQLAPLYRALPKFYENKDAMLLVENAIDSKMAFLTDTGSIYTIGKFTEDGGLLYSNTTYKGWGYYPRYGSTQVWDANAGKWTPIEYDKWGFDKWGYDEWGTHKSEYKSTSLVPYVWDEGTDSDGNDYYCITKLLMPVSAVEGAFYVTENGDMVEDDNLEVFIDISGNTWWLDSTDAIAYRDDNIIGVYNKEGMALKYDVDLAEYVDCVVWYDDEDKEGK